MNLPVDIEDTYDDGCEDEINKSDTQVKTRDYESESSLSVSMWLDVKKTLWYYTDHEKN